MNKYSTCTLIHANSNKYKTHNNNTKHTGIVDERVKSAPISILTEFAASTAATVSNSSTHAAITAFIVVQYKMLL